MNQWKGLEHLDLIPNHGQVLDLKIENLELDAIVNFGQFLLPFGNKKFRLGATYNWNEVPDEPTDEAKEFLLSELKQRIEQDIVVESQKTGFRPTSDKVKKLVLKARENGDTIRKIAKNLKISPGTVVGIIKRNNNEQTLDTLKSYT